MDSGDKERDKKRVTDCGHLQVVFERGQRGVSKTRVFGTLSHPPQMNLLTVVELLVCHECVKMALAI